MSFYTQCVRPILFQCDPEWIHNLTLALGEGVGSTVWGRWVLEAVFSYVDPRLSMEVGGIRFPNPVGMAAGFDKNGRVIQALSAMGFGPGGGRPQHLKCTGPAPAGSFFVRAY